jgi:hypothetical protein
LERIVISLTVNTNCERFQTKKTGMERKTCKSNSCFIGLCGDVLSSMLITVKMVGHWGYLKVKTDAALCNFLS